MKGEMESRVYNAIASRGEGSNRGWLVMDSRGEESYRQGHIKGSLCVSLSSHSDTLVKVAGKAPFPSNCWWGRHVLLVVSDSKKRKTQDPVLQFLSTKGSVESLLVLGANTDKDGDGKFCTFSSFSRQYPFLITKSEKAALVSSYPSEILPQFLYVGDMENATSKSQLDDLKISHVLTIHSEPVSFHKSVKVKFFNLEDEPTADISQYFQPAYKFIADAEVERGRVLVHCGAGVSRSATLCAAYLMRRNKWGIEDTLKYLKERRNQINPNRGFISALHSYEEELSCLSETNRADSTAETSNRAAGRDYNIHSTNLFRLDVQKDGSSIGDITILPGLPVIFGRSPTCNIVLEHASISRQHAKMEVMDEKLVLTDLRSSHGTFVGGRLLEKGQMLVVNNSDEIHFGASSRRYVVKS